jgi:hypothetical protein
MGEFGRRKVAEELAWEYSVENLLSAYERVSSKKAQWPLENLLSAYDRVFSKKPL